MNFILTMLPKFFSAMLQVLINPFYYVGILFVLIQYRRQISLERKLFFTKLHSVLSETWRTLLWGWVLGVMASSAMIVMGVTVQRDTVVILWIVSLLLMLVRVRLVCWAYAIGLIGVVQAFLVGLPDFQVKLSAVVGYSVVQSLTKLNMPSLLMMIAILHIVEAVLMRTRAKQTAMPVFCESKRGKIVGGYQLSGFWPIVLFFMVPVDSNVMLEGFKPIWIPPAPTSGWAMLAFPVMIGFSELTLSRLPQVKARITANRLTVYAFVLIGLSFVANAWPFLTPIVCAACIVLHEALALFSHWDEAVRSPFYVHDHRGLRVLAILPGSPAAKMKIRAGEIIYKVNGLRTITKQDLHEALESNPSYCKMEMLSWSGRGRVVERARFDKEHHQLGMLLAPDEDAVHLAIDKPTSPLVYLLRKLSGGSNSRRSVANASKRSPSSPTEHQA